MKEPSNFIKMNYKIQYILIVLILIFAEAKSDWVDYEKYSQIVAGGSISKLKISNDGKRIFSVTGRSFEIWDFESGKLFIQYDYSKVHYNSTIAGISSDDSTVVVLNIEGAGTNDKKILFAYIYKISNNTLVDSVEVDSDTGFNKIVSCDADFDYKSKELLVGFHINYYWPGSFDHRYPTDGYLYRINLSENNKKERIIDMGVLSFKTNESQILILGNKSETLVRSQGSTHSMINDFVILYDKNLKKYDTLDFTYYDSKIHNNPDKPVSQIDFSFDGKFALGYKSPNKQYFWSCENLKQLNDSIVFKTKFNKFKYLNQDINFIVNYDSSYFFYKKHPFLKVDSLVFDYRIGTSVFDFSKDNKYIIAGTSNGLIQKIFTERLNLVKINDLNAEFNAQDTIVYINQSIQFRKEIPDIEGEYLWDFGDGSTSNEVYPLHSYNNTGTFEVKLSFKKGGNDYIKIKTNYIKVINENIPDFSSDRTLGLAPLSINFKNNSKGEIISYFWEFGDGEISTEENPSKIYNVPGFYHVRLSAQDIKTTKSIYKDFFIVVDSVEIEKINITNKIQLKTNFDEKYMLRRVPIRGEEISPDLDIVWAYFHMNVRDFDFSQEVVSKFTIENNIITDIQNGNLPEVVSKPVDDKLSRMYFHNFYWDSCGSFQFGVFSQTLFNIWGHGYRNPKLSSLQNTTQPNQIYFGKIYNSFEYLVHSLNLFPVTNNKSYIELYSKKSVLVDGKNNFIFNQINNYSIEGNLSVFQKLNENEFVAIKTDVGSGKSNIDMLKLNIEGNYDVIQSNISKYNSIFIHDFKRISQNEFIACGLVGMSSDSGKAYIAKFDDNGKLLNEYIYDNDIKYFAKIIQLSKYEFIVQIESKLKNQGYYLFDNNLKFHKNYRLLDTNYHIIDIYKNYLNKIKILAIDNSNPFVLAVQSNQANQAVLLVTSNDITSSIIDINEPNLSNSLRYPSISPNPATDYINIQTSEGLKTSDGYKIQIFDILGIELSSAGGGVNEVDGGGSIRIDISNLPAGVYFIRIGDIVEKFLKM